ncbi:protein-S-isoprenylcysteine O-methyltransferase [Octopus bimaculoides]|uniref:Protein-S-isoprenylcysteine O-methyltransferase n=1 Tax=Octopus bimaculoides TaxID=37653 RepID=A0A0L8HV91_OCTBM|nr:protein-S-isoprenylcysteine O-methyltransferase [Octopus bimaculoides]|eukprot:XP_014769095.1 PREDICTED: protein-S-isoprenylcysteine O-methyltransferase-like [Octopus bimaculoides]
MASQLIREGKISLLYFLIGAGICCVPSISWNKSMQYVWLDSWKYLLGIYTIVFHTIVSLVYISDNRMYQIALRSGSLGLCFGLGVLLSIADTTLVYFGWYVMVLSFFHWSEYFMTAVTNPRSLSLESFLLDHSREYKLAVVSSWIEYTLEWLLYPEMKLLRWFCYVGLVMVIGGEILRKCSMYTARSNFNHYIQYIKQDGHTLVTRGVYSLFRHPAYVGWFYWSIGTQLILCNPFCLVGFTIVSWRFFQERIHEEEIYLLNFFGEEYFNYQKKVGTGLPFINGYRREL